MAFFVPETHDFSQQSSIGLAAPKKDPEMSSRSKGTSADKDVIISVDFAFPDVTGTCWVEINGVSSDSVDIINGKAKIITHLTPGKYTPHIYYSGDEQYLAKSIVGDPFTVSKQSSVPID